jgi:hypothetical protein
MTEKVTPTCRYGHGPLVQIDLMTSDGKPRGMMLSTFEFSDEKSMAMEDGNGYSVIGFRCSVCRYMEFFDEGDD